MASDLLYVKALELVPGSEKSDWNPDSKGKGLIYKDSSVDETCTTEESIIYGNSNIIGSNITNSIICSSKIEYSGIDHSEIKESVVKNSVINHIIMIKSKTSEGQLDNYIINNSTINMSSCVGSPFEVKLFEIKPTDVIDNSLLSKSKVYYTNVKDSFLMKGFYSNHISIDNKIQLNNKSVSNRKFFTQKALGIHTLNKLGIGTYYPDCISINPPFIIRSSRGRKDLLVSKMIGKFVRPCPERPRHGFVDSRLILSESEALQIIEETRNQDKKAEFIITNKIDAEYSGIWTPGSLVIGPSNDGATQGKNCISIPISGIIEEDKLFNIACNMASIKDSPYIEILWKKYETSTREDYMGVKYAKALVQLRDGPEINNSDNNFIPRKIKIKNIIEVNGEDLLEWEKKTKNLPNGTVVYHPGGSLQSHYSIHCILNDIPVIVDFKPEINKFLIPRNNKNKPNIYKIKQGFACAIKDDNLRYYTACLAMLVGCHSISDWIGKKDFFLGYSMGCCVRLSIIACISEFRYSKKSKDRTKSRAMVYDENWKDVLSFKQRKRFLSAVNEWKSLPVQSTGGKRWYIIAEHAKNLLNCILSNDIIAALSWFNKLINLCHNGGWVFNKFLDKAELDIAAESPARTMLEIAPLFYEISKNEATSDKYDIFYNNRREWDILLLTDTTILHTDNNNCECSEHNCSVCSANCDCKNKTCHDCGDCGKCCNCKYHICKKCYPNGCDCKNKECHDCKVCIVCCGCLNHECFKCYPSGCICENKECHDCMKSDCVYCSSTRMKNILIKRIENKELGDRIRFIYSRRKSFEIYVKDILLSKEQSISLAEYIGGYADAYSPFNLKCTYIDANRFCATTETNGIYSAILTFGSNFSLNIDNYNNSDGTDVKIGDFKCECYSKGCDVCFDVYCPCFSNCMCQSCKYCVHRAQKKNGENNG